MKNSYTLLICLCFLLDTSSTQAFTIVNESATANRIYTSWTPAAPGPLNTDGAFLGTGYDHTAFGWNPNALVSTRPQVYTLISPMHAANAWHYSPAQGDWRALFVSASGNQTISSITGRFRTAMKTNAYIDVAVNRLSAPLAASTGIATTRLLDIATSASTWNGLPIRVIGGESTGPSVALASVGAAQTNSLWVQSSTTTTNWLKNVIVGDSGSPAVAALNGEYALVGHAWSSGGDGGTHGYSIVASPASDRDPAHSMNVMLGAEGYALRWLIYDNPSDSTRTAPVWSGGSGTDTFSTSGNWSPASFPSDLPVILDASAANSQHVLNLSSSASLRGLVVRAATGTQGFTFSGSALTLGTAGIINRDDATLTFNNPLVIDAPQNWEALGGDITVNGGVSGSARALTTLAVTTETTGGTGTNEVQKLIWLDAPGAGTFTITFNGQTTAAIPYNATAVQVAAALQALSNIGNGNVSVFADAGFYQITFQGALAQTDVPEITATLSGVTLLPVLAATSAPGRTVTVNSTVSGQLNLAANSATLVLASANTYTGRTWVNGGTLLANNSTGSATGNGSVTVRAAGLLGGTGTIAGVVTISNSGEVSGLTFPAAATAAAQDKLDITGALALGSSSRLLLTFPSGAPQINTPYTVLTAAGGITGTAPAIEGTMPANTVAVASISGNNLLVTFADTAALPFAPSGFTASAPNDNSVVLRWTDNAANETGYRLERSSDGVNYTTVTTTAANATSYTDSIRPAGISATYRLTATNAAGDSSSITATGGPLPSGFTAGQIGSPPSAGLCNYNAGVYSLTGIRSDGITNNASDNAPFLYRSISGNGTFTARFTAASNISDWSPIAVMFRQTTANNAAHYSGISYFDAVGGTSMNGRYRALWRSTAGANAQNSSSDSFPGISSLPTAAYWLRVTRSGNTFTTETSANGTTWTLLSAATTSPTQSITLTDPVLVGLVFSPGNTSGTDATVTVDNVSWLSADSPSAPSSLAVSTVTSSSQLTLTWTDNASNETGFQLERSPDGTTGWSLVASPAANATSATDSGLATGTTYHYRLRATNAAGDSAYSATASATTWSAADAWRMTWFGSTANSGSAAEAADPDGDGVTNSTERASSSDPTSPGAPATAAAPALPARVITFTPSADAYVTASSASTNTGTATDLLVRTGENEAFLRYDLSGLTGTVERAQLVFWATAAQATSATYTAEILADNADDWSESMIAWSNKPASSATGAATLTTTLANDSPQRMDVTTLVANTLASDPAKLLGLRLYATGTMAAASQFGSRENSTSRKLPYLHITMRTSSAAPTKLMHVGDSITRGANGAIDTNSFGMGGSRLYLHNLLLAGGLDFRAVGPLNHGAVSGWILFNPTADWPNTSALLDRPMPFPAHSGQYGQPISYIRDNIASWMTAHTPDVVTLMIGTNDILASSTDATATDITNWKTAYTTLLNNLLGASPTAKVVLAKIPPLGIKTTTPTADNTPSNAGRIAPFNSQVVQALYDQFNASHPGRFFLVDNYTAIAVSDIGPDGIHPGSIGHQKIARSFHAGIMSALARTNEVVFVNQGSGADASLRGGTNADTAFGNATTPLLPAWVNASLRVKADPSADARAKAILKFDLAGLPEKIATATLGLAYHGTTPQGGFSASAGPLLHLYGVLDGNDSWAKSTATWTSTSGHDTASNSVLPANTVYLASVQIPANSRTGDLITFSSSALAEFLTWQSGTDNLASFILVAAGTTSQEAVFDASNVKDYPPAFLTLTTNTAATFANWGTYHLADSSSRIATADPDGDGMSNLLEYALGGDPVSVGSTPAPTLQVSGVSPQPSYLTLSFPRTRSDVTYIIQGSNDLVTWSDLATNPGTLGQAITFTDSADISSGTSRRFLRLKVTSP